MGWLTEFAAKEINKKLHESGDIIGTSETGYLQWDAEKQMFVESKGWTKLDESIDISRTEKKPQPIWLYVTIALAALMVSYFAFKR